MKYAFMADQASQYAVTEMSEMLDVSRSGYYAWVQRQTRRSLSVREQADQGALQDILNTHQACKAKLGQRKLWVRLKTLGRSWGRDRVARLMRQHGLVARKKRPFRPATTDSTHHLPVARDVLARDFTAPAPNQKWVSDITYLWTAQGWLYLCVVLDLYSRRVVGWALMDTLESTLVLTALRRAVQQRHPLPGLIFHSDRGSQYASYAMRELLALNGMIQSMSRAGNCWDNAVSESWFSAFKTEAIPEDGIASTVEAQALVFEHIEAFYNSVRPHTALGFLTPIAFEIKHSTPTTA